MDNKTVKLYRVNNIFASIQGEGAKTGIPMVFLRFAGCNRQCNVEKDGFDCDTEWKRYEKMSSDEIASECKRMGPGFEWVLITGGEPGLQIDAEILGKLHNEGFFIAVETNGTIKLPIGIEWITVSPKGPPDKLKQEYANEVKHVVAAGKSIPDVPIISAITSISPAFHGSVMDRAAFKWCAELIRKNPKLRLSVQNHKLWGIE